MPLTKFGSDSRIPINLVKTSTLSAGSFLGLGEVTTSETIGWVAPQDLVLKTVTVCRSDLAKANIEILNNGVVISTVPVSTTSVVDESMRVLCSKGDIISARSKMGSSTISDTIVCLWFEVA